VHADTHTPLSELAAHEGERLQQARVLIVGVGGLGSPAALSLAAAGIGQLGLIDSDSVDISNLHRQVIYRISDIGRPKVFAAAERLTAICPRVSVRCFHERLTAESVPDRFRAFDFVIDATDGIASKYLVNDGAVLCGVPFSHAGIVGFRGQTMTVLPRRSACLRCLFPLPPDAADVPSCRENGILGTIGGSIGSVLAAEALKSVLRVGRLLADRLLTYDALCGRWRVVEVARNPRCPLCGEQPSIRALDTRDG
jgi:molybdopterin-synthase adenylyltransferase